MSKVAIITDSNSGITQAQGKELGIFVLPTPFFINEELFFEDISLTQEAFYARLAEGANISTSQPSPGDTMELWEQVLEDGYEEIVHIPISSGLSSSYSTAVSLATEFDGKVQVVDNQRVSVTQKQTVLDAKKMADAGKSAVEIKEVLMKDKMESSIYITVDTLQYLKKGGRITPAAALVGEALNLKPVLQIQGEKLDAFAKVRGLKKAKKTMLKAMKEDLKKRFKDKSMKLHGAYTCSEEEAMEWKAEIEKEFSGYEVNMEPLSLSVACHIGPGSIAIATSMTYED